MDLKATMVVVVYIKNILIRNNVNACKVALAFFLCLLYLLDSFQVRFLSNLKKFISIDTGKCQEVVRWRTLNLLV